MVCKTSATIYLILILMAATWLIWPAISRCGRCKYRNCRCKYRKHRNASRGYFDSVTLFDTEPESNGVYNLQDIEPVILKVAEKKKI
jgi:hypothetical protein